MDKHFDIRPPRQRRRGPKVYRVPIDVPYIPIGNNEPVKRPSFKIPMAASFAVFLLVIGFFGFNLIQFKEKAEKTGPVVYNNFKAGAAALFNFDLSGARDSFQKASDDIAILNSQTPLNTVPAVLDNLFKLSQNAVSLSADLEDLKKNGLALVINKKGAFLIQKFQKIKDLISTIDQLANKLKGQAAKVGYQADQEFSGLDSKLGDAKEFLGSFIGWLEAPKKQRLLVLFQNPSEIRPSGGFIGSYAIATLFQGNLLEIETRDIYDPDGQLDLKLIPPKQLQSLTDKWGARDANWFFDFPMSARKVIELLEASKIYSERGIRFAGALAVNVEVIRDLVEITGPFEMPEYNLTITGENFLREVQREVEAGKDKAKGDPKKIIKTLAPMIFGKIAQLSEEQKNSLLEKMAKRFSQKDLLVYFKDPVIQRYARELGAAGEVYELPKDFVGEYLAVVNTNVAGGKSDAMVDQKISLHSVINNDGSVSNKLNITRSHSGISSDEWWYKATNRDYLQVYTTPSSHLEKVSGNVARKIQPAVDYSKHDDYATDRDLALFEESEFPFGKSLFANWLYVKAGEKGKLTLDYSRDNAADPNSFGKYQFVFDKQSGVGGSLEVSLVAPEGFHWKESGAQEFEYSNQDLPARVILDLNLEAIPR
ncbi:MAG: Uncharacterized protein G01um101419_674 [Parcubacteria group bacterium Gr01-1014_19]|nr:MAG: Uncharacterized protein G01um101419_674 [Parcubacteria group bacterium Gr01-1014_19]